MRKLLVVGLLVLASCGGSEGPEVSKSCADAWKLYESASESLYNDDADEATATLNECSTWDEWWAARRDGMIDPRRTLDEMKVAWCETETEASKLCPDPG